jgi:ribose transport system substrate-binding protein
MSVHVGLLARRPRVGVVCLTGVVIACGLFAGCGSTASSSATSSGSATSVGSGGATSAGSVSAGSGGGVSAAAAAVAKLTGPVTSYPAVSPVTGTASLKGKTVWWIPIGEEVPVVDVFGSAMQSALAHLGISMHSCDGRLLPTTIASCLNQAVRQGASAVVTGYVDYKMVPTAMNAVVAHKIPLLVAGEPDDAGPAAPKLLAFANTDPAVSQMARLGIDAAISDSNGKAQILYIGAVDSPALVQLNSDAAQEAQARCPSCVFHTVTYLTPDLPKVPSEISAALIRYPKTTYVVAAEDIAMPLVIEGVESAGFGTKIKFTTLNGSLVPLEKMKSGSPIVDDIGISGSYLGWSFADGIVRMMVGHTPVAYDGGIRVFDKQNVASLTLTPAAYATNAWYGPSAYQSAFLNAWAGK